MVKDNVQDRTRDAARPHPVSVSPDDYDLFRPDEVLEAGVSMLILENASRMSILELPERFYVLSAHIRISSNATN